MNKKILIVEDQFVEANDLQLKLRRAGYDVCGIARSVEIAQQMIEKEKPALVLLDIFLKGELTGVDLARQLSEKNIGFVYLSANSNEDILAVAKTTEPYGFIVKPFREKDLLVTLEIAQYRQEHSRESKYRREAELMQHLEAIAEGNGDWTDKLLQVAMTIQREIPFDYIGFGWDDTDKNAATATSFLRISFTEYQAIGIKELATISNTPVMKLLQTIAGSATKATATFLNDGAFEKLASKPSFTKLIHETFQMNSMLSFPLVLDQEEQFGLCFYGRRPDLYNADHVALLHRIRHVLVRCMQQQSAVTNNGNTIKSAAMKTIAAPNNSKHHSASDFAGIVGNSHLLLKVFDHTAQVAPHDTTVLLLGESGTGKERIADCIHKLSSRKGKPLVKVNCATLPPTLIESELFGHERGSFTGATDKRIGKFEQANGGTIFLDEIGEMPVDLQVKLLRVLQEKEIEPVGSMSTVKIDVRVIAATNRNLEKEVGEGRFRLDLYYRLNVFPIMLPSLKDRMDDIPALSTHFIEIYNRKAGKKITGVSDKVLMQMMGYSWPGNIREFENLMERSVLLATGSLIEEISLPQISTTKGFLSGNDARMKTILENEREYIISVLKKCNGKIWGARGAADALNLPPSTLNSKMKKLGIRKQDIE